MSKSLIGKIGEKIGLSMIAVLACVGVYGGVKNLYLYAKDNLNLARMEKSYKSFVINYVDKENNGLSFEEDCQIKELMGIKHKHSDYSPTFKDWENAYNKVKSIENISEQ